MTELYWHIGVGVREIDYLFSKYKRISNEFTGILTDSDSDRIIYDPDGIDAEKLANAMIAHGVI